MVNKKITKLKITQLFSKTYKELNPKMHNYFIRAMDKDRDYEDIRVQFFESLSTLSILEQMYHIPPFYERMG